MRTCYTDASITTGERGISMNTGDGRESISSDESGGSDAGVLGGRSTSDTTSRRAALKKAAAGSAAAATVWVAPKVEGLSLVPDYAAAGTATTGTITFQLDGNNPAILGGNNWMNAAPSPQYTVNQDGPSDSQDIILTAPLGPAGNAVWTFPKGQDTDGPAIPGGDVVFNIDPPFNRCRVIGGETDWAGSTSPNRGSRANVAGPTNPASPLATNPTSPFTVPISILNGPGAPGNNSFNPATMIQSITVEIQCF